MRDEEGGAAPRVEAEEAAVTREEEKGGGCTGDIKGTEAGIGDEGSEGGADGGAADDGGGWQPCDDLREQVNWKVQYVYGG